VALVLTTDNHIRNSTKNTHKTNARTHKVSIVTKNTSEHSCKHERKPKPTVHGYENWSCVTECAFATVAVSNLAHNITRSSLLTFRHHTGCERHRDAVHEVTVIPEG